MVLGGMMRIYKDYEIFSLTRDDLIKHVQQLYKYKEHLEEYITLSLDVLDKVKKIEKFHEKYVEGR
jgi:hypothetical protein